MFTARGHAGEDSRADGKIGFVSLRCPIKRKHGERRDGCRMQLYFVKLGIAVRHDANNNVSDRGDVSPASSLDGEPVSAPEGQDPSLARTDRVTRGGRNQAVSELELGRHCCEGAYELVAGLHKPRREDGRRRSHDGFRKRKEGVRCKRAVRDAMDPWIAKLHVSRFKVQDGAV